MTNKFYSELISEEFYEKISFLRKEKDLSSCNEFAFIFVNSNTYECKHILEKKLSSTEIGNDPFTNIVVFGYSSNVNQGFFNQHYKFIGIFDMNGNESSIDLGTIALNSISTRYENYNTRLISGCNVTLFWTHFDKYMEKVLSPIENLISSSLKKNKLGSCFFLPYFL